MGAQALFQNRAKEVPLFFSYPHLWITHSPTNLKTWLTNLSRPAQKSMVFFNANSRNLLNRTAVMSNMEFDWSRSRVGQAKIVQNQE